MPALASPTLLLLLLPPPVGLQRQQRQGHGHPRRQGQDCALGHPGQARHAQRVQGQEVGQLHEEGGAWMKKGVGVDD